MKKVTVRRNDGSVIVTAVMENPDAWIKENVSLSSWGHPERWVSEYEYKKSRDYLKENIIAEEDRPAFSDDGQYFLKHFVKVKSDYSIEVVDCDYQVKLEECINNRMKEYPTPEEFMNAFFDGNLDEIRMRRLRIKLKYPKPNAN